MSEPPALTHALIDACHPEPAEDDPAAQPETPETELEAGLQALVAAHDLAGEVWIFGYGSLMWNPEMDFSDRRRAAVTGWARRYCLWQWRYRGTRAQPGMMLALDRGPHCEGIAFRLAASNAGEIREKLRPVWWREMRGRAYHAEFVACDTPHGPVRALTFVANRDAPRYAGALADHEIARNIARASGARGTSAAYLLETWQHCREVGIAEPMLERLQAMVAAEMSRMATARSAQSHHRALAALPPPS